MKTAFLISFYAPPCSLFPTSSLRVYRLAKGLVRSGFKVDLLTLDYRSSHCPCPGCRRARSCEDTFSYPQGITPHWIRPQPYGSLARTVTLDYNSPLSSRDRLKLRLEKLRFFSRSLLGRKKYPWRMLEPSETGYAFVEATLNYLEKEGLKPPDLLLTSSGPYSLLFLGRSLKEQWGSLWVADLRDSLTGHTYRHGWIHALLFTLLKSHLLKTLEKADEVISVSPQESQRDKALLLRPILSVPPGWDPEEWVSIEAIPEIKNDRRFKCLYAGRLYPGYISLTPFLKALELWLKERSERIPILYYYGPSRVILEQELQLFPGLREYVELHEPVPLKEIRRIMRSVDLLILPTSQYREGGIGGGKLYEYLGAGTPILSYPNDPFVAEILKRSGSGFTSSEDPAELLKLLRKLSENTSKSLVAPYEDRRQEFTYLHLLRPLLEKLGVSS